METKYEKLCLELEQQFPNCPFDISCIDELYELDEIFTNEPVIFIYDDRSNCSYLKVERINGIPITLRHVINSMSNDRHYRESDVVHDDHRFLEQFILSKHSNIQYTCFWGS